METRKTMIYDIAIIGAGPAGLAAAASAKENGIDSIGVLYGYASENELSNAGADALALTAADLLDIIQ